MTRESLRIRILDALEERPMGIREIAEMVESPAWNVREVVKRLASEGLIERVGRGQSQASGASHMRVYAIKGSIGCSTRDARGGA